VCSSQKPNFTGTVILINVAEYLGRGGCGDHDMRLVVQVVLVGEDVARLITVEFV